MPNRIEWINQLLCPRWFYREQRSVLRMRLIFKLRWWERNWWDWHSLYKWELISHFDHSLKYDSNVKISFQIQWKKEYLPFLNLQNQTYFWLRYMQKWFHFRNLQSKIWPCDRFFPNCHKNIIPSPSSKKCTN